MTIESRRASDSSKWFKLNDTLAKYKTIFWLIAFFLLAAGFDFRTPKQVFKTLEDKQSILFSNDTSLSKSIREMSTVLNTLVKIQCREMTARDRTITNLCDNLK